MLLIPIFLLLPSFSAICPQIHKQCVCFSFAFPCVLGFQFISCPCPPRSPPSLFGVMAFLENTFKLCYYDHFLPFRHYYHTLSFPCHFNLYLGFCPLFSPCVLPLSFISFSLIVIIFIVCHHSSHHPSHLYTNLVIHPLPL